MAVVQFPDFVQAAKGFKQGIIGELIGDGHRLDALFLLLAELLGRFKNREIKRSNNLRICHLPGFETQLRLIKASDRKDMVQPHDQEGC